MPIWLCSQFDRKEIASAQSILQPGVGLADIKLAVKPIIEHKLTAIHEFTSRLVKGELPVE